jgi:hypothetical protein
MTSNSHSNLPPHKRFKHLYLGKGYEVVDLNIDDSRGNCVFKTEDGDVEVSGSNQEFLDILSTMVKIKEEGQYKYVDPGNYPIGDKESFSENLKLFETPHDNPVERAVKRINKGSVELPEGFNLLESVECVIECEFNNKYVDYIVNNPYVAIAISNSCTYKIHQFTEQYKDKAKNKIRYSSYARIISKIFHSRYMSIAPDLGLKRWRDYCENDLLHSGEQVSSNIKHHRERARRIAKEDISIDGPIIELQSLEDESRIGGLEPEMGMREIADEYASLSETIKPLLKDLLVSIDPDRDRNELKSLYTIKEKLSESNYSFLSWAIEPQLRHGPSHSNIKIDEDEGKVLIYDRDDSNPGIEKQMSYEEVVNTFNQLKDLTAALLHTFIHAKYKITTRFLNSEEFKYHCSLHYRTTQS